MLSVEQSKPQIRNKTTISFLSDGFVFAGGAFVALLLLWAFCSFSNPNPNPNPTNFSSSFTKSQPSDISNDAFTQQQNHAEDQSSSNPSSNPRYDPPDPTFYDDPNLSYSIEQPIKNWDEKRRTWLKHHPSFAIGAQDRILLLTGSQPEPCRSPVGDHLLLRFFKNKLDYARIHGHDIFYNNALLHPKMTTFWAKLPLVRSAMITHPEAEWIWWVDSDAAFTDMDFKLPLQRYKNHNLIVHGWPKMVYEMHSWVSLNAGVFLIRNCQWSMDFMEVWAKMGPQTPDYDTWSKVQKSTLPDKLYPEADDQSGLVYLLLKENEKWGDKIYLENEFYFEGYWEEIVGKLRNVSEKYLEIERRVSGLRRRHAEKVEEWYGVMTEAYLKDAGDGKEGWRRPFITHFTGCEPCSGNHNEIYSGQSCWNGMQMALNFADNQVLRRYGFVRYDLLNSSSVSPLPFDYPA